MFAINLSPLLERKPDKTIAFCASMAVVLILGVLDFLSGYEVSMFVFYAVPIAAAAWFVDKKSAVFLALISGLTWWWADQLALHPYRWGWLQAWETMVRLSFFLFAALTGALIRSHYESSKKRIALLEHSQRLEHEIVNISEQEQLRIGQDLHDGICQYLAALGYSAASLQTDLQQAGHAAFAASAKDLADRLRDSVTQTRDLARGLVPVQLDAIGLASALEELTRSASQLLGIDCTFDGKTDAHVPDHTRAIHLYRIAQEAINNATRHGQADGVHVRLIPSRDAMELIVEDNGSGFSNGRGESKGMGLSIMRHRAHCLGGELHVEPNSPSGTTIRCIVREELCQKGSHDAAA